MAKKKSPTSRGKAAKPGQAVTPPARRADVYRTRAKIAQDWSAKTADAELQQGWLKIAQEYRMLVQALEAGDGPQAKPQRRRSR